MLPATKAIPKEMLPLVDKPLIQYVVNELSLIHILYEAWLPLEVKQKMAMFAGGASGVMCLVGGVLLSLIHI